MKELKAGDRVTIKGDVTFMMDHAMWTFENSTRVWEIEDIDYKRNRASLRSGGYGILHSHPKYGGKPGYTYGNGSIFIWGDELKKLRRTRRKLSWSNNYIEELERQEMALKARHHSGEHFFKEL